jgi:hypothetical protein
MGKHTKKGAGGKREGAGPPLKYGEELEATLFWCPVSKKKEFQNYCKAKLKTWEVNPDKQK